MRAVLIWATCHESVSLQYKHRILRQYLRAHFDDFLGSRSPVQWQCVEFRTCRCCFFEQWDICCCVICSSMHIYLYQITEDSKTGWKEEILPSSNDSKSSLTINFWNSCTFPYVSLRCTKRTDLIFRAGGINSGVFSKLWSNVRRSRLSNNFICCITLFTKSKSNQPLEGLRSRDLTCSMWWGNLSKFIQAS